MLREALRILEVCGEQILEKKNRSVILEPKILLKISVPGIREKGSWNLNRITLIKKKKCVVRSKIDTCHKQHSVNAKQPVLLQHGLGLAEENSGFMGRVRSIGSLNLFRSQKELTLRK